MACPFQPVTVIVKRARRPPVAEGPQGRLGQPAALSLGGIGQHGPGIGNAVHGPTPGRWRSSSQARPRGPRGTSALGALDPVAARKGQLVLHD